MTNIIALELVLIALGYAIVTIAAQRKFSNVKRIREIKIEMNMHQDHLRKEGKTMSKEEMDAKQKQIMSLTSEMMRHQLKASLVILPVFIILVYFALPYIFGSEAFSFIFMSYSLSYRTFFIMASIILGVASQAIVAAYDKMAATKAAQLTIDNTKIGV